MTTTEKFRIKPDFYNSLEECDKNRFKFESTNPRYKDFKQTHFTAGDEEQFQTYRNPVNGQLFIPNIDLGKNLFKNLDRYYWDKNKNLTTMSVINTFRYMFHKLKKGIFVKIKNNKLDVFLPFSKKNFSNEWSNHIKINPKYKDFQSFVEYIHKMEGRKFYPRSVNKFTDTWFSNNCLLRYEFPCSEGDTNVSNMSDMLKELCANRELPDMEFFLNRRDFPVIKRNNTEPYHHIYNSTNHKLVSHEYNKYSPILSMSTTNEFADITIPTGDDWSRVCIPDKKFFVKQRSDINGNFKTPWVDKKPIAVFRGSSTGYGVDINNNMRLRLAYLSSKGVNNLLDAGITSWNLRPRKICGHEYIETIDIPKMNSIGIQLVPKLTPEEQSKYKYIINIEGHVAAFRLSTELSMGCCILKVESPYKLWYSDILEPYVHYVPVKADLSNLESQVQWCIDNEDTCQGISKSARLFYDTYLNKDGIFDYLQKVVVSIKNNAGLYIYNNKSPLELQIEDEAKDVGCVEHIKPYSETTLLHSNKNNTVTVSKYTKGTKQLIIKKSEKMSENIHETWVALKELNKMNNPNFCHIHGMYKQDVIADYIPGQTFDKWIKSDKFNMKDYLFILIQLSLSLETAQKLCGFVHWDLLTWNIIIKEVEESQILEYVIDYKTVYRVKTKIIPVIIDFGKSHVVHNGIHHGYINMYKKSTIQDVISILLSSVYTITLSNSLHKTDVYNLLTLSNFISRSGYKRDAFKYSGCNGLGGVKYFFGKAKKYGELISSNKHDLEKMTPIDFVRYIESKFSYTFQVEKYKHRIEYKIESEYPKNVNLEDLDTVLCYYMLQNSRDVPEESYTEVLDKNISVYDFNERNKKQPEGSPESFNKRNMKYTESDFSNIDSILTVFNENVTELSESYIDYKNILVSILTYNGKYRVSDSHRDAIIGLYGKFMKSTDSVGIDRKTLLSVSDRLYKNNMNDFRYAKNRKSTAKRDYSKLKEYVKKIKQITDKI